MAADSAPGERRALSRHIIGASIPVSTALDNAAGRDPVAVVASADIGQSQSPRQPGAWAAMRCWAWLSGDGMEHGPHADGLVFLRKYSNCC